MLRIIRSPAAMSDIDMATEYIAQHNIDAATRFLRVLDTKFRLLSTHPHAGPPRGDLLPGVRSFPVANHLILYRVAADSIEILRIIHGAVSVRRMRRLLRQDRSRP